MMISPQSYVMMHKNDSFDELIKERDLLIESVRDLEKIVYSDDRSSEEWSFCPGPDVQYQMYLEYLGELCKFMKEKYNREIVWREPT